MKKLFFIFALSILVNNLNSINPVNAKKLRFGTGVATGLTCFLATALDYGSADVLSFSDPKMKRGLRRNFYNLHKFRTERMRLMVDDKYVQYYRIFLMAASLAFTKYCYDRYP